MVDFGATQLLITLSTLAFSIAVATTTAVAYALFKHRLSGRQFGRASNADGVSVSGLKPSTTPTAKKGIAVHRGSVPTINANTTTAAEEEDTEELRTSESSGSYDAVCGALVKAESKNGTVQRTTTIDEVHESQVVRMKQSSLLTNTIISKVDEVEQVDLSNGAPTAAVGDMMEQMAGRKEAIDGKLVLQPVSTSECSATTDGPLSEIAHSMSSGGEVFGNENTLQLLRSSSIADENDNKAIQNVGTRTIVSRELTQVTGSNSTAVSSKTARNANKNNESDTGQLAQAWTAPCTTAAVRSANWTIDAGDTTNVAKVEEKVSSCRNASVDRNLAQLPGARHVRASDIIDLEQVACGGCNSATVCKMAEASQSNNVDDAASESDATGTSGESKAQVEFRSSVQAVQVVMMAQLSRGANSVDEVTNPASRTVSSQAAVVEDVDTRQSHVIGKGAAQMLCLCSTAQVDGNNGLVQALENVNSSQFDATTAHDEVAAAKATQTANSDSDASSAMNDVNDAVAYVFSESAAVASTDDAAQQVQMESSEDVSSSINEINVGVYFEKSITTANAAGELGNKCETVDTESIEASGSCEPRNTKEVVRIAVGRNAHVGKVFHKKTTIETGCEVADAARMSENNSAPAGDAPQIVRQGDATMICEVAQMMPDHDGSSLGQVAAQMSANNEDSSSEMPPEPAAQDGCSVAVDRPSEAGKHVESGNAYGGAIVYCISEPEYSNNSDATSFYSDY